MCDSTKNEPEAQEAMLGGKPLDLPPADLTNEETTCGIWFIKGKRLQKFANEKVFVLLNGISGLIMVANNIYFNGTISTIEKRFKLNSETTGFILVGYDSCALLGTIITYYAGKQGHKPRWIAIGLYATVLCCVLNAVPHLVYGPGEDALSLTSEYGGSYINSNYSQDTPAETQEETLCREDDFNPEGGTCKMDEGNTGPVVILFAAQCVAGMGGTLHANIGTIYLDDNIKKSKIPALINLTSFVGMLGPIIGSSLSAYCLSLYISPSLHPKIDNLDPRWRGAWWLGWIVFAGAMSIIASLVALFPRQLPRAYARRLRSQMSQEANPPQMDSEASVKDFFLTSKRLLSNKIWFCNAAGSVFFLIGATSFWLFGPKYMELMFKVSATKANFATGTVGFGFTAVGLLASGLVLSKYKPSARNMTAWDIFVGLVTAVGFVSYSFLGCVDFNQKLKEGSNELQTIFDCNRGCHCDHAEYSPVCANGETFISPCHAGCTKYEDFPDGSKIFKECSCAKNLTASEEPFPIVAHPGPCPPGPSCTTSFNVYLAIQYFIMFLSPTVAAGNVLISIRCVDERDKPLSMALNSLVVSLLAFIPAPIIVGKIIDSTCLVWGRTCTGKGNCWLHNGLMLRNILAYSSAAFTLIGISFRIGVWLYVKDLNCFAEEEFKPAQAVEELTEMAKESSTNQKHIDRTELTLLTG